MAVSVLRRGASGLTPAGVLCRKNIASGITGRRYRAAYRKAERYARLLRLARKLAVLFFLMTQVVWPVRQFFGNLSYEVIGLSLRLRERRWKGDAIGINETAKSSARPVNWRKLYIRVNTALAFLACGIAFFTLSVYRVGLEVFLDGKSIGYVSRQEVVKDALSLVDETASEILGHPYTSSYNLKYQFTVVNKSVIFDRQETVVSLLEQIPQIGWMHVLRIDGETIGAMESKTEVDALLESILSSRKNSTNGRDYRIVNDVSVTREQASRQLLLSADDMKDVLLSEQSGEVGYTVRAGDTALSIAQSFGLTEQDLLEMNFAVDFSALREGQRILVKQAKSLISIAYERRESKIETVAGDTQYLDDDSLWLGETMVVEEGKSGQERVYTQQTVIDGYARPKEVIRRETISNPATRIIAVGTKQKISTGTFIRPTNGRISSNYGYRILFGKREFHQGIDYASPIGTPIHASDGGVVVRAESASGYGLLIVVDHGGGFSTAYAHCSKLIAKVGQTVGQGEVIALVGNTGRSTGPHVHFEIRENGVQKNPALYLR